MPEVNMKQRAISSVISEVNASNNHKEVSNIMHGIMNSSILVSRITQSYEGSRIAMAIVFLFFLEYTKAIADTEDEDFAAFKKAFIKKLSKAANEFS